MTEKEILSAGLHELGLGGEEAIEKLLEFSALLLEKNRVMNLTAVSSPCEVVTRHFLDCAVLAPLLPAHAKVVDVGCGAGFRGTARAARRCGGFTFGFLEKADLMVAGGL